MNRDEHGHKYVEGPDGSSGAENTTRKKAPSALSDAAGASD